MNYPEAENPPGILVSIGTGVSSEKSRFGKGAIGRVKRLLSAARRALTDTENAHKALKLLAKHMGSPISVLMSPTVSRT